MSAAAIQVLGEEHSWGTDTVPLTLGMVGFGAGEAGVVIYRYLSCTIYENGHEAFSPMR